MHRADHCLGQNCSCMLCNTETV